MTGDTQPPLDERTEGSLTLPSLPLPGQVILALLVVALTALHARLDVGAYLFLPLPGAACVLLFLLSGPGHLTCLLTLLAVPAAFLAAPDAVSALRALVTLPVAFAIAVAVTKRTGRMAVIIIGAGVAAAWAAGIFGLTLLIGQTTLSAWMDSFREELISTLTSVSLPDASGTMTMLFSEESAELTTRATIMVLPTVLCWLFFLASWFTTVLTKTALRLLGAERAAFTKGWRMRADRASAVLFVVFQLLSFLFSLGSKTESLYYAFSNLTMIFLLPLAFVGLEEIVIRFRTSDRFSPMTRLAAIFLVVMIAVAAMYFLLFAAALYGAVLSFRRQNAGGAGKEGDP